MTIHIKTIYLDMDGVLTNFTDRWIQLFNESPSASREGKDKRSNWKTFVETEQFASLPTFPGWDLLIQKVMSYGVDVEILSSSGGERYHDLVTSQKKTWLKDHGIDFPVNIVPGRRLKANYATPTALLIDDTPDVIMSFYEAGGHGILHESAHRTLKMLDGFFE